MVVTNVVQLCCSLTSVFVLFFCYIYAHQCASNIIDVIVNAMCNYIICDCEHMFLFVMFTMPGGTNAFSQTLSTTSSYSTICSSDAAGRRGLCCLFVTVGTCWLLMPFNVPHMLAVIVWNVHL